MSKEEERKHRIWECRIYIHFDSQVPFIDDTGLEIIQWTEIPRD